MKTDSKLFRAIFTSPWLLLIFFVIPFLVVLSVKLHIHVPFTGSKYPLLYNNACFTLLAIIRLVYYLPGLAKGIRYGAGNGVPRQSTMIDRTAGSVRNDLAGVGYVFDRGGNYGEKRDRGYLGAMILYAGLSVVLVTGLYDNMFQFSGTLYDGIGVATDLKKLESYRRVSVGPFIRKPESLPKMRIVRQFFPDATYPKGATEVAFKFPDGREQQAILKSPVPFRAGAYDIYMSRMVYEPKIAIMIDEVTPVFNGTVTLNQIEMDDGGYGFYGTFAEGVIDGKVYYQPDKSRLRVVLHQGQTQLLDTELIFQVDRLSRSANFSIMCERMGVWSEIYVVHRRHMPVIFMGGILFFVGLLMRVMIRPRRVWLEEAPEGCRIRETGGEVKKILKVEG